MKYTILVQNQSGNVLGEFETFRHLTFSKRLNNYGECSFSVPIDDPKINSLIALRRFSVWIYRDNLLVWSGEQVTRVGDLTDKGNNWVTIYCFDWIEQLKHRYVSEEVTFTQIDAGDIAWSLINTAQTEYDMGITEGNIEETMDRDRTYKNTQNIYEAIINLTNVINGFDFEINNSKVFNVYAKQGIDRSNLILEYGYNIKSMQIVENFKTPINRAIVIGDSGEPEDPLRIDRNDAGLQTIYGLREGLINELDVTEISTLEEKGDALIRKYGSPLFNVTVDLLKNSSPNITDFALGDYITLKVNKGIYNIESAFRVYEWQTTVEKENTERLYLVIGDFIALN